MNLESSLRSRIGWLRDTFLMQRLYRRGPLICSVSGAEHVIADSTFRLGGYRAGEIYGHHMPKIIEALLMVNVDRALGAARFVNGDWSEIELVQPTITRLVTATGWSTFVMVEVFIALPTCRHGVPAQCLYRTSYRSPCEVAKRERRLGRTSLPAKTAAAVQRLADANFPLQRHQAQGLLRILDALIDLGDRRSAAL